MTKSPADCAACASPEQSDSHEFRVKGMDCAEEVAILKRELGPLTPSEDCLKFDLIQGKLTVHSAEADAEELRRRIKASGMEAIPWQEWQEHSKEHESFWARRGRVVLAAASGVFLAAHVAARLAVYFDAWQESDPVVFTYILLAILAIVSGGWYIFPKAVYSARRLRPDMNLLMTVAVLGAIGIGEWFEAASVTFLFAVALLLESWSVSRARRAIESLLDLSPATARYICPTDGDIEEKPVADVPVGATVLVRPGERIPLDGEVSEGATSVDQSPITGESRPVRKAPGDEVFAGTVNIDGAIEFTSTRSADYTTLARIIHMVEEAQGRRAPAEKWVERFARIYTPAMLGLAVLIAIVPPLFTGAWEYWFYEALVILVIACPCALVISTPVSIVAGMASAARAGVLIKGGAYLEAPSRLRAAALDKTGTVTRGFPEVQKAIPANGCSTEELLRMAAALESRSEHPLARAIVQYAKKENTDIEAVHDYRAIPGEGGTGALDGRQLWIGSLRMARERAELPGAFEDQAKSLQDDGHSVVVVGEKGSVCGLISLADGLRPQAREAVAELKAAGVEHVIMLTGDNEGTARAVAEAAGMDEYRAELLPENKIREVERLVKTYGEVAMVGDGVNDAPALAAARVGIAMGAAGTDAAIETADIALMSDDIGRLGWLVRHSRRTVTIIRQNIFAALAIKVLFVALTFMGVATLWMAIAADMGTSLLVIFNGLRLLKGREPRVSTQEGPA